MNQEDSLRREIHQTLDAIGRPTPELLPRITDRLHPVSRRRPFLAIGQVAAVLGIGLVVGAVVFSTHRSRLTPTTVTTSPITPIVAGPGADIAWVTSQTVGGDVVTGIDPDGHVVGRIKAPVELRSPDGAHLYAIANGGVAVYSAVDGHEERTIRLQSVGGGPNIPMLSADGRYVAVVGGPTTLELVDLWAGRSVASINFGSPAYGVPVIVGAQAQHIYVIGETSAATLTFDGSALRVGQSTSGQALPCNGPSVGGLNSAGGLSFRVMADGRTLVAFCPFDGRVSWFDLERMTVTHEIVVSQRNPFWTTPVFSSDGKTLYLDEGMTGAINIVDLTNRTIVRSMKLAAADTNPLAWFGSLVVIPAYAGGIPRTAALSPDGTWLYAAGAGLSLVSLPDLSVKGRWIPDVSLDSVWASADGRTIYVLTQSGDGLRVLRADGSQIAELTLPSNPYGFIVPTIP